MYGSNGKYIPWHESEMIVETLVPLQQDPGFAGQQRS